MRRRRGHRPASGAIGLGRSVDLFDLRLRRSTAKWSGR
jgi:hypothetical protein